MQPAAILSVLVTANTAQASRSMLKFNATMKATEGSSNKALGAVNTFAKGAAIGVGGALAYSVKKAADFESQLASLGAVTDANRRQMKAFQKQALDAGAATKFSALDAAQAQTELAKGGLSVRNILRGGLRSALALAAAGELDLGQAASTTANAMNLFGIRGNQSIKVADALAKAANATTADVGDFAMALTQGGGVAKQAGLSFTETVLALEALAKAGVKNSDAGTSLKTSLIQLLSPTEKQQKTMSRLNLDFTDAAGNFKNLSDISTMLQTKTKNLTREQRLAAFATIAGTDGVRTLTALYDAGAPRLDRWRKGLQQSGTAADVAAKKQDTLKGKLENLRGSVETIAISFGSKLIPGLTDAAEKITDILNDKKLTTGQKFDRLADMLTEAVSKGLNKAVQLAGEFGPKAAGAFARSWFNAPIWTKLAVGGFLFAKLGGFRAFFKVGASAGAAMGAGMAEGAAATVAGGGAGAAAGAAGGGLLGKMRGKLLPLAKRGALIGVGAFLADTVISEFGRQSQRRGPDMFKALEAEAKGFDPAGVTSLAKKIFTAGPLPGDQFSDAQKAAKALIPALQGISNASSKISSAKARELREQIAKLEGIAPGVRKAMNSLVGNAEDRMLKLITATNHVRRSIGLLRDGLVFNVRDMRKEVGSNFNRIVKDIGADTERGRNLLAQNFGAGLKSIKRFVREGKISTAEGMREIARLMENQSGKGAAGVRRNMDAVRKTIVGTLARATDVTASGLNKLRSLFVTELRLYGISPKQALAGANVRTGEVRGGHRRQDFARGGPINQGKPSGDSVPAMLERGEYVLNRNAVKAVGRDTLDAVNFKAAKRFQAGGVAGMVGAANRLDKAQFPYLWGGGHQGSPAPFGPMDCSGAVSYVLQHGGVKIPTMVSGALAGAGQPGPGKVTVFANNEHTFMRIGNRYFGTSGSNPGGGAGWFPDPGQSYKSRFAQRHFAAKGDAMGMGNVGRVLVEGRDSALKSIVQGSLDATRAGANKRLQRAAAMSIGSGDAGDPGPLGLGGTPAKNLRLGRQMAVSYGWVKDQWNALKELWNRESGWSNTARNPSSGAFGIPQALPPTKMPKLAQEGDARSQIAWGLQYIKGRYGNPGAALAWHDSHNWYAKGGPVGYTGDSLGVGTEPKLKGLLDRAVHGNSKVGRASSAGLGILREQAKHNAQLVFDLGTNDGSAGSTRSSLSAAARLKKPLHYFTVKGPEAEAKNRMFKGFKGGDGHLVDWARVAGQYTGGDSQGIHPNAAGYAKRAQMLAASIRRATKDEKQTGRDKAKALKPFKGSLGRVLNKTIKALRHGNAKVRGTRLKQFARKVNRTGSLPKKLTDQLSFFSAAAENAGVNADRADRAGQLNIDNDDETTTLGTFQGKDQGGWLNQQLSALLAWRNKIIDAVKIVEERRKTMRKLLEKARARLKKVSADIKSVTKFQNKRRDQLKELRKHPKQNKDKIAQLRKVIMTVESWLTGRGREQTGLKKIIPTIRNKLTGDNGLNTVYDQLTGEEGLVGVQGPGGPMGKIKGVPPLGQLGGTIFDVQLALRDLNTKGTGSVADAPVTDDTQVELLKQLLREANLRTQVSERQFATLRNFDATSGAPFLGAFAKGGVALVGERGPELAHLPNGTRIHSADDTRQMLQPASPEVNVRVNVAPGMDWLKQFISVEVEGQTRRQSRRANRGLPGRGGGV